MDNNKTYTATLTVSSGTDPDGSMQLGYTWDPPLVDVLKEFGEDRIPASFQLMGIILDTAVFPTIALNERYEATLLEHPEIAEMQKE